MKIFFSFIALTICTHGFAQESESNKKNRIAPLVGYVFVPEQIEESNGGQLHIIPTFGVDYERILSPKWAIGSFNDIELSSYFIRDSETESGVLKREFVFISTICAIYTIMDYWTVYGGVGYEFETHQNFAVLRFGTEYEIPIRNEWDVTLGLSWDYKEVYNSIGFTIAFGKRF